MPVTLWKSLIAYIVTVFRVTGRMEDGAICRKHGMQHISEAYACYQPYLQFSLNETRVLENATLWINSDFCVLSVRRCGSSLSFESEKIPPPPRRHQALLFHSPWQVYIFFPLWGEKDTVWTAFFQLLRLKLYFPALHDQFKIQGKVICSFSVYSWA